MPAPASLQQAQLGMTAVIPGLLPQQHPGPAAGLHSQPAGLRIVFAGCNGRLQLHVLQHCARLCSVPAGVERYGAATNQEVKVSCARLALGSAYGMTLQGWHNTHGSCQSTASNRVQDCILLQHGAFALVVC
jgi:hypothetical protein